MKVYVPDVSVSLDDNTLTARAMLDGTRIKADIRVDAPDLGKNIRELAGRASGFVTIGGTLDAPVAKAAPFGDRPFGLGESASLDA